jgi:iron complex transport system permease protein
MSSINVIKRNLKNRYLNYAIKTAILGLIVIILCITMMMLGEKIYSVNDVIKALINQSSSGINFIINKVRLPKTMACLFAGLAFGIAGNVFQNIFRNPLANPNVVGVTSGSSAAAVFCIIVLQASQELTYITAIIGGLLTVLVIFALSLRRKYSASRIILIGIGMQAMLNSAISYMLSVGRQPDIPGTLRWLSGTIGIYKMVDLYPLMIVVIVGVVVLLIYEYRLRMLMLGEQTAKSLGVKTTLTRLILIVVSVCLVAFATATTGPIAYVSFLAGPIAKQIVGKNRSGILASGFTGAILVLGSELIGQYAFTLKYPVGVITGILGAPCLIILIIRMHKKGVL